MLEEVLVTDSCALDTERLLKGHLAHTEQTALLINYGLPVSFGFSGKMVTHHGFT